MRRTVTLAMVVFGVVLAVVGYVSSAGWSAQTLSDADPAFVGAPLLFVVGVVLVVGAAVIYELLPDKE